MVLPNSGVASIDGQIGDFAFSPDGRWLYFRANDVKPNAYAIYRYELANDYARWVVARYRERCGAVPLALGDWGEGLEWTGTPDLPEAKAAKDVTPAPMATMRPTNSCPITRPGLIVRWLHSSHL